MNGVQRFTQEEIQSLPRWARLAFAARCVRRAQALLQVPAGEMAVIERAVALVESASRRGQAGEQLADAAAAAYKLALDVVDLPERPAEAQGPPDEDDVLIVMCTVAHAAAFAAEAATIAIAKMASYLVSQSVDFAVQAHLVACADAVPEVVADMRKDLEQLQEAVADEGWGNLMPVPPDFFEPLS
jgi:hypothetical protein